MSALFLAALLAQVAPRDARPAPAVVSARISGIVTTDEARSRPLRRARVTIADASQGQAGIRMTITGDEGTFAFDVPAGRFTIAATKEGYAGTNEGATRPGRAGRPFTIAAGESRLVTLRLAPGAVITGAVYDVDGSPATGVPVTALTVAYSASVGERRFRPIAGVAPAVTDDRGVYRIYGLRADDYVVQARLPQGGTQGLAVRMMRGGEPVARPMVLSPVYYPGSVDGARAQHVVVGAGEERNGVDLQLQYVPLATVSGSVSGTAAATLITLARTGDAGAFDNGRVARADGQGRFTFNGITPGQYRVTASLAGGEGLVTSSAPQWGATDVQVDGDDVSIALSMQPALTIAGRVVFEGDRSPIIPALARTLPLTLSTPDGGRLIPPLQLEADGTFKIERVIPGTYRAFGVMQGVRAPIGGWWLKSLTIDGRDVLDAPLDIRQSTNAAIATFSDRASDVTGALRDATGAPVSEMTVVIFSADRTAWFLNSRRVAGTRPTRDGRYVFRNLPPGEYRLAAADLDQNEWFDPVVLERLLPSAASVTIAGNDMTTVDLVVR